MALLINCECGYVARADSETDVVELILKCGAGRAEPKFPP